jgi:hypothetical protein
MEFLPMEKSQIPPLSEMLKLYYSEGEMVEIASVFDVSLSDAGRAEGLSWLAVARQLVERVDHGNRYEMLKSLLSALEQRNKTAIGQTDWESREAHRCASPKIESLLASLGEPGIAREIVVGENKPFSAKSEVREFLEKAQTEVYIIDPYIGMGTLDCLRTVKHPIRLLTGSHQNSIESGFDVALRAFQAEGFQVMIKQHSKLHDRHLVFNDRCWLVGSSLKDAGRKAFHTTEIIDCKAEVLRALNEKWVAAGAYSMGQKTT